MDKKELKKQLDKVLIQLKNNSKDAKFAEQLIDKAMSLKGQLDVEEVELIIPASDVVKRYDFDSFEFVRCKGGVLFHVRGGYRVYVTPQMVAIYEHLVWMLDNYDNVNEENKTLVNIVISETAIIMEALIFTCGSDEALQETANFLYELHKKMTEKLLNQPLQEETYKEDAKFENDNKMLNEIMGTDA